MGDRDTVCGDFYLRFMDALLLHPPAQFRLRQLAALCVACVRYIVESRTASCRYLPSVRLPHGAALTSRRVLGRGCAAPAAPWMEARTRGPGHQPRAAGKLSRGVLLPAVGLFQFQDMQPRDVDHPLCRSLPGLLVVVVRLNRVVCEIETTHI